MPDEDSSNHRPLKPREAREQAADYLGFMNGIVFDLGNGETWELPNPSLLDDDQRPRYDAFLLEQEGLDRHPDKVDSDGNVLEEGAVMVPQRKAGVLVEHEDIRLAKALMGSKMYAKFKAGDGRSSQLAVHWWQMNKAMADRVKTDPKSDDSDSNVDEVSDGA